MPLKSLISRFPFFRSGEKFMRKMLYYFFEPDYDPVANVRFIHAKPKHGNLGDDLCSPKHYWDIRAKERINIIGGGADSSMSLHRSDFLSLDFNKTVVWGVGRSVKGLSHAGQVDTLPFVLWSCRDQDAVADKYFVPCVSCMHPMLSISAEGDETLIYMNVDGRVTPRSVERQLQSHRSRENILFNNCTQIDFSRALASSSKIITNSFHGAYWGLLSGREVALIGYSSKFYSLYKFMGLDVNKIIPVKKGDSVSLINALNVLRAGGYFQSLPDYETKKNECIDLNLRFAESFAKLGLVNKIERKRFAHE